MELETTLYNHILGGLYGQALGDAWGMPAYLRPDHTWQHYNGWLETLVDAPDDHPVHAGLKAGEVTDDTQQAVALAKRIIKDKKVTVEGAAQAIVEWYDEINGDASPYVGPSTRRGVTALKEGADPTTTGTRGDTNGGAMRISPIGLIHPGDINGAVEDAVIACTPTHFTDVAVSAGCAVAAAVAQAAIPTSTLEEVIEAGIQGADAGVRRGHPWMGPSVARKIGFAVQLAREEGLTELDRLQNIYDFIGSTLAAADAVPAAFGILALADGSPSYAGMYAAALSGDADTVGAIACAICGAWQGIDSIEEEHIQLIQAANPQYNFEEMAESLYQIGLENYHTFLATLAEEEPLPTMLDDILNSDGGL